MEKVEMDTMERAVMDLIEVSNERCMAALREQPIDTVIAESYEIAIWLDVKFVLEDIVARDGVDDAMLAFYESTDVLLAVFEEVEGSDSYPDSEYIVSTFDALLDAFIEQMP